MTLSHYTTRHGLEGILETETLWATHFLELNDRSEFFYAWNALQRHALAYTLERIPEDIRPTPPMQETMKALFEEKIRENFASSGPGFGDLFVTSFAKAGSDDHVRRGIRTLWDIYTGYQGYCLQFSRQHIERILDLEMTKGSYASAGLVDVIYGVDVNSREFRSLSSQLGEQWLLDVVRAYPDSRIVPDYENQWAPSYLTRKVMEFCASHKDPCFEDEREVRIFLWPAPHAEARVFTGIAAPKKIRTAPNGKHILVVGEFWKPGIIPHRILIGPKANRDIDGALKKFEFPPEVALSDLPIA